LPKPTRLRSFSANRSRCSLALWRWFASGEIYEHLWVHPGRERCRLFIGTVSGVAIGLWLALSPTASAIFDPYIKAINAMPRVILAPIFFVWFGLGIASKVALGVTLVFFIVFFNVYQGVREVSPVVLANARMLGASPRQLLRHVYVPSAMSWVFRQLAQLGGTCVRRSGRRRISGLGKRRRLPHPSGGGLLRYEYPWSPASCCSPRSRCFSIGRWVWPKSA